MIEEEKEWIFTWGFGQKYPNRYVIIKGTFSSARQKMVERYGNKWAFQYPIEDKERLESHGIRSL